MTLRHSVQFASLLSIAPLLCAQAPNAAASRPEFEVASIKPSKNGAPGVAVRVLSGGRFSAENTSPKLLIRVAYNVEVFQISGGPGWIATDRYDVNAKAESNATLDQMRPMLQSLLADRFKLALHSETKELNVYELVVAKGILKLAPSKEGSCITPDRNNPPPPPRAGDPPPRFCENIRMGIGRIEAFGASMPQLVEALSATVGRTVIDKTGLVGKFDVHLEFTPDERIANPILGGPVAPAEPSTDSAIPSVFTALQEQLGLKLESKKGPVEILVIDHVERPSEN